MASTNIVILAGNLTRNPEVKQLPSGASVASLSLAVNRRFKSAQTGEWKEDATFVDVDMFGRQAEIVQQYLNKGSSVLIEGRLQLDRWEDKETGKKRSKLKVIGNRFQFLNSRGRGNGAQAGGDQENKYDNNHQVFSAASTVPAGAVAQEDIPF